MSVDPLPPPAAPHDNPLEGYAPGDAGPLAEAMLAPGEREPDIDPAALDPDALRVIRGLRSEGYQAYLVGGCVRDLLLGRRPKDFDIATSAHPGEIRSLFRNCRLIGRRFRLAHVYFRGGGKIIEVATFRRSPNLGALEAPGEQELEEPAGEAEAESEATPDLLITEDNVFGTAEEDARRRDFTINGLFYDVTLGRVLDYVGGLRDLDRRLVRTIGDPEIRLREDPVRLLRAVRFAARLECEIEPVTYAACEGAVEDLPRCAPPRLLEEIFKILRSGAAGPSFALLEALGALPVLLPTLHAELVRGGEAVQAEVRRMLAQVDARVASGIPVDDAVSFAALLEPVARRTGDEEGQASPGLEELLDGLVRTARLSRRMSERIRHLLSAQRVLAGEKRRKRSQASFRRAPYFADALDLFAIRVEATGEGVALLEQWRSGGEVELPSEEPGKTPPAGGGRKRRRRRHRRGGAADEPPAPTDG